MAVSNKKEIKVYFELNDEPLKEVAKRFKVKYRTLAHWVKSEGWERGKFAKNIRDEVVQDELLQKESFNVISAAESKIKRELTSLVSVENTGLDGLLIKNMIDKKTDEILMQAMGISFINKNIALMAIISKDETMRMLNLRKENEPSPLLVGSAEKTAKIFSDLKTSIYGKEAVVNVNSNINDDLENLSDAELRAIIEAGESQNA